MLAALVALVPMAIPSISVATASLSVASSSLKYRLKIKHYLAIKDNLESNAAAAKNTKKKGESSLVTSSKYDMECAQRIIGKPTHYPLISADGLKAIADYVYEAGDDSLVNDPWRVNKEGSVVYVAQVREKERKRERERERERESIV